MINIFKENKKMKEELEELKAQYYKIHDEKTRELFNLSYYNDRIDKLEKEINKLKIELTESYEKNYELAKKLNKE